MKYEELKQNLKKQISPVYVINGGESLLTISALNEIEKALNITIPDFNKVYIPDDYKKSASDIIEQCQALPIIDAKRLIVVYDYINKKNEHEKKIFEKYFEKPNLSTCLVFFSTNKSDFLSSIETNKYVVVIDCQKPSVQYIFSWVKEKLEENRLEADKTIIDKLVDYTNYSVTKLDVELSKLKSIKLGQKNFKLTDEDIENYVNKDLEYVIFDLTNAISIKDKNKVFLLIDTMIKNKEQPSMIISTLSNHFRRLFFISRSNFLTSELAQYLNVKEFAIKKYKEQLRYFSQKQLKEIYDKCLEVEFLVKNGKMEAKNSLYYLVSSILK